jgi:galactose mutarotase-like enzyme
MPLHFGLHPYFRAVDKRAAWLETDATLALNNRSGAEGALERLDFDVDELDLALLDHDDDGTVLHRGEGPPIQLRWSPRFRTLVLWTLRGKDFICVEPWTAPGLALATGEGLLHLEPGESMAPWLEISI